MQVGGLGREPRDEGHTNPPARLAEDRVHLLPVERLPGYLLAGAVIPREPDGMPPLDHGHLMRDVEHAASLRRLAPA